MLSGTDASGWGTGQCISIDGAVEEHSLRFTRAEARRPINWRELLGIVRVVEKWGDRLRGKTLLVETDNTVAQATAAKFRGRSAEMQELLRRLLELCELYQTELRPVGSHAWPSPQHHFSARPRGTPSHLCPSRKIRPTTT